MWCINFEGACTNLIFLNTGGLVLSGNVFSYSKGEIIALYRDYCRGRFTSGASVRAFPVLCWNVGTVAGRGR